MKTEIRKTYEREWRKRNQERVRRVNQLWKESHREIVRESNRQWSIRNPEKEKTKKKRWVINNRERNRMNNHLLHKQYKLQVMMAYGGHCKCCGENELAFLTLEHENRNGKTHRKVKGVFYLSLIRRRFPKDEGLSVLCMNCNWATRLGAKCPHQKAVLEVIRAG